MDIEFIDDVCETKPGIKQAAEALVKLKLFEEGKYICPVPAVPTHNWTTLNWITWIDWNGKWTS